MRPDPSRARAPRRDAAFAALDPGTRTRVDAIRILKRWTDTGDFPDRLFGEIPSARRGFAMDLVYATVRNVRALDFALRSFLAREPEHPHAAVALLLGAAQILKMPDVAEHAAVFSTVEALKALDGPQPCGFANGVLRNLLRNRGVALETLAGAPLAVRESHPDAQVARWTERFGAERAEAICKWDNEPASPVVLSLPHRPSPPELMASFLAAGVEAKRHPGVPERALVIPHGSHVDRLPGFAEGLFSIQDPATLEAVRLLDVRPGQRVLDACAAPGGKSVQIAALLEGTGGSLVSMDCWRDRLVPLRDNLRRFGFDGLARVVLGDAKRVRAADVGATPSACAPRTSAANRSTASSRTSRAATRACSDAARTRAGASTKRASRRSCRCRRRSSRTSPACSRRAGGSSTAPARWRRRRTTPSWRGSSHATRTGASRGSPRGSRPTAPATAPSPPRSSARRRAPRLFACPGGAGAVE